MRFFLILALLTTAVLAHATVYKWVDKDGKIHYSDEPIKNAEIVEFKENTQNQIKLPPPVTPPQEAKETAEAQIKYQLSIVSPAQEETVRDNSGNLTIVAGIKPELSPNHLLALYMDGKLLGEPQSSAVFSLQNIDRGEHSFVIKALSQSGRQLASTPARKIFLHRTRLSTNNQASPPKGGN